MKYRWPLLDRYAVPDQEALLSACLASLENLPLVAQFRARDVVSILARPLLVEGGLFINENGGLTIAFDSDDADIQNVCVTIGHELGHTFEIDPRDWEFFVQHRDDDYIEASENFAEAFSLRWLSEKGCEAELAQLIEKHFTLPSSEHILLEFSTN